MKPVTKVADLHEDLQNTLTFDVVEHVVNLGKRPKDFKEYCKMAILSREYKSMLDDYLNSLSGTEVVDILEKYFGDKTITDFRNTNSALAQKFFALVDNDNDIFTYVSEKLYHAIYTKDKRFTYDDIKNELYKTDNEVFTTFIPNTRPYSSDDVAETRKLLCSENLQLYDMYWNSWHIVVCLRNNNNLEQFNTLLKEDQQLSPNMKIATMVSTLKQMPLWSKLLYTV